MNILFVHPSAQMSISDVARGYRAALERMGHNIRDYRLYARLGYHNRAIPSDMPGPEYDRHSSVARAASETILNEALYHQSNLVLIISGLNLHPIALWLLGRVGIPAAAIFTESPYDDEVQAQWANVKPFDSPLNIHLATNDRFSAEFYGWQLLAPSFDPAIHRPRPADPDCACDVLMVGSGWPERQSLLESINWDGINLKLYGIWPGLVDNPNSPIHKFYSPLIVSNNKVAEMYCSAKISLNFHRASSVALTWNPRVVEIAACGAFQLSDNRVDLGNLFGTSIPTFNNAQELEDKIRYFLSHPELRYACSATARHRVADQTFDNRAAALLSALHIGATDRSPQLQGAT